MSRFLFPAIDLIDGQVVRLHQGDYAEKTVYGDSPLDQAKLFEDAGATWLHVVDLDGAKAGHPVNLKVLESIRKNTGLKIDFGGGIRNTQAVRDLVNLGVDRVVVGTAAFKDWEWFQGLAEDDQLGPHLVLGVDAKDGKVAVRGWLDTLEQTALGVAVAVKGWKIAAINFTDIATDGTLKGPNLELTREVAEVTDVPVIASGGVGTLQDLIALKEVPVQGAIVGRALYEDRFTIQEALAAYE